MSEGESEGDRLHVGNQPTIATSEHAARGMFTCTNRGLIVAQGSMQQLAEARGFDTVYCHEDDEAEVLRILIESPEHSSESLKARFQRRFSIAS